MTVNIKEIVLLAAAAVNIIAFFIYGIDKRKARKEKRRIPEKTLLWWGVFAPFGAFAGMRIFRHKTQKPKFYITLPFFCIMHIAAAAAVLYFKL